MENFIQEKADNPFNATGRFGRMSLLAWNFLLGIVALPLILAIMLVAGFFSDTPSWGIGISLFVIVYIALIYCSFVFTIRRLHDLNKSGWLVLLNFVPLINVAFVLYIFCARGDAESNNFGAPRITQGWEKVLAWINIILIPIALIILIAIAVLMPTDVGGESMQMEEQYYTE